MPSIIVTISYLYIILSSREQPQNVRRLFASTAHYLRWHEQEWLCLRNEPADDPIIGVGNK